MLLPSFVKALAESVGRFCVCGNGGRGGVGTVHLLQSES